MKQEIKETMKDITLKVSAVLGLIAITYPFLFAIILWLMVR